MGTSLIINPELRSLLVCPVDHATLCDADGALACTQCARRYPVVDGIPNMAPEEESSEPTSEA